MAEFGGDDDGVHYWEWSREIGSEAWLSSDINLLGLGMSLLNHTNVIEGDKNY